MITENNKLIKAEPQDITAGLLIVPSYITEVLPNAISLPEILDIRFNGTGIKIHARGITNTSITTLYIDKRFSFIDDCAFENNRKLAEAKIFNRDLVVKGNWFNGCTSLGRVTIGGMVYPILLYKEVCYNILSRKAVDIYTVYYVQRFKASEDRKFFVATKQQAYGTGETIERAIEECRERYLTPDLYEKYKDLNIDSYISSVDYRLITGACDKGVIDWLNENHIEPNQKLQVRELLKLLRGKYGYEDFCQFVLDCYAFRANKKQ